MGRMVQTMQDIQEASQRIGDIIGVIDGIAFQTNILALNAAVEAARAGESGRGFAVVASEVRALAGRSATAAAEIKQLITSSSEQVASGTRIVAEAGEAIEQIVQSSGRVQQLLQAIGHGALEQAQGMSAMGTMIQEVDASTQQNAALVEQTAAAATQLADTARTLAGHVASFRLPSPGLA
jgi:methyl-accepting chemotaxis protein